MIKQRLEEEKRKRETFIKTHTYERNLLKFSSHSEFMAMITFRLFICFIFYTNIAIWVY